MTAIIGFGYGGFPVLIGDVVESVSSKYAPSEMYFPSVGKASTSTGNSRDKRPSGLIQKLAIIGDNLVIAWTGTVSCAQDVLTAMQTRNDSEPFDLASLSKFLEQQAPSVARKDLGLIGIISEGEYWTMFQKNVETYNDKRFGQIFAGGTGAEQVAAQLRKLDLPTVTELRGLEIVGIAASLSASLITHEVHHRESLKNRYGGAYEIVITGAGKPEKIEDILYVHWMTSFDQDEFTRAALAYIYHNVYWNDLLIVRTVKFAGEAIASFDSFAPIRPVFRELTSEDYKKSPTPSLRSGIVCHLFTFRDQDGEVYSLARVDIAKNSEFQVTEEKLGDSQHIVKIKVAPSFFRDVNNAICNLMGDSGQEKPPQA